MKLFLKSADNKLFDNYRKHAKDGGTQNQDVVVKIFNPNGAGTWYIINSDPDDPNYLWGIAIVQEVEMGSISRSDLENYRSKQFGLPLERDLSFDPINADELYKMLQEDRNKDWSDDDDYEPTLSNPVKVEPKPSSSIDKPISFTDSRFVNEYEQLNLKFKNNVRFWYERC